MICVSNKKNIVMRIKIFLLLASTIFITCSDEENLPDKVCSIPATVRDLTGLDGCGFVFELQDGQRLIPLVLAYCGTPPLPPEVTENPLYNFNWEDGKQVMIDYYIEDMPNNCMVGPVAKITCVSDYEISEEQ